MWRLKSKERISLSACLITSPQLADYYDFVRSVSHSGNGRRPNIVGMGKECLNFFVDQIRIWMWDQFLAFLPEHWQIRNFAIYCHSPGGDAAAALSDTAY